MRYLLILLLLAGCASREERQAELIGKTEQACEKLGFKADSPEMRDCKLRLYESATRRPAVAVGVPR